MTNTATASKASTSVTKPASAMAHAMTKAESTDLCSKTLAKMSVGVRNYLQAGLQTDKLIATACFAAMQHAAEYGDARPADNIVREIEKLGREAGVAKFAAVKVQEVVSWFRENSPVYWDAQAKVHLKKEGENGYKPFNVRTAEAIPFYATERVQKSRAIANAAADRALNPVGLKDLRARALGILKWAQGLGKPDANGKVRDILPGQKTKLLAVAKDIATLVEEELPESTIAEYDAKVDEKQVAKNVRLLKKGSRAHKKATARAAKPAPAEATAVPAA